MRLTTLSDYALRVLTYAAASGDKLLTIEETARTYQISRAHLMKVVNILVRGGYLRGVRGRSGGFMLAKAPEAIVVGDVIRVTEPDFALVECFNNGNRCIITGCCKLPTMLNEALNGFIATLDRYTIADLMLERSNFYKPNRPRTFGVRGPTITTGEV
jgi:Rrf2 family transcriptional regulator, nitric oxide-sensitive transcriptional repressor